MFDYPVSRTFREYEAEYYEGITLPSIEERSYPQRPKIKMPSPWAMAVGMELAFKHMKLHKEGKSISDHPEYRDEMP